MAIFLETAQGRQEIDAATLMGGIGGDLIGAGGDDDLRKKIDAKLKETRQGRLPFFNPQAGMTKAEAAKSGFEQAIKTVEDVVGATSKAGLIIEGAKALNDIFKVVPLGKGDESIGQVPNQIEHDSSRIRIEASPRNILRLALPRAFTQEKGANVPFLRKVIRGEATNEKGTSTIAPPWLKLKWDEEVKKWRVSGHEGRTRSIASLLERGDDPIPIDLFLKNKVGNRITEDRVTPEMRKALTLDQVIPQGRRTKRALPKDPVTIGQTFNAPPEEPEIGKARTIDVQLGEPFSSRIRNIPIRVSPSKNDIRRLFADQKRDIDGPDQIESHTVPTLRYAIHADTRELYIWDANKAVHSDLNSEEKGGLSKLPVSGSDMGFIYLNKDGSLTAISGESKDISVDELIKGKTVGEAFMIPPMAKKIIPTIDEAFPDKENIVSFRSVDLKDSLPKAVLNKFSAQGLIPDQFDVDLFGGAGGIFKEAGREQAKTMFKFPKQEGFPSVDLTKARTDLADGSVGSVIADFPFLVNKYLGSSSSSTKKLGAIQGSFAVNTKGELKLIQITGAMEAIRILEPGGVALFKTQDVRPVSGLGRKIFIPSTQVIMDVAEGQGMKLIGRQSVKSRGKGIKPVEWLVYKKTTGDVLPFKKE